MGGFKIKNSASDQSWLEGSPYQFEGLRFDCGSVPGFVDATQYVFEHYYGQPE